MPELEKTARNQLLLHQFLAGIPNTMSRQLRAAGETKILDYTIERARPLMAIDAKEQAAVIADDKPSEVDALREQVAALTEQIAALTARPKSSSTSEQRSSRPIRCNLTGYVHRECLFAAIGVSRIVDVSYSVNRDISPVNDVRENDQEVFARGSGRPNQL